MGADERDPSPRGDGSRSSPSRAVGRDVDGAGEVQGRHFEKLKNEVRPFPGATSLLRQLHGAGLVVVLATSASEKDVTDMRKLLDADDAIDEVVHAGDAERSKPAPDIFDTARKKGNIDAHHVLALGDSVWDVRAARAARIGCVAVESGGSSRHELAEAGAIAVYRDVQEVSDQLATSPFAGLIRTEAK